MSKLDDINRARVDAMEYATRQIKAIGMDAWEKELKLRMGSGLTLPISRKDLDREADALQNLIIRQCLLMSLAVVLDEFDFTREQLAQFAARYNRKADCMGADYHLWQDYADMMKEEYDIDVGVVITKK